MMSDEPKAVYVRLDPVLREKLDRFVDRLAAEQPGLDPTRSHAIRILLNRALDADDREQSLRVSL